MHRSMPCSILALLALFSCLTHAAPYSTLTTQCDGLAQLPIVTLEGLCLGLVAQKSW
jgi:hypothetical protein